MSRVALVTGCSSGIGRVLSQRLAAAGWVVYAGARAAKAQQALGDADCIPLSLDVCDEEQCARAVERIESESGGLDALVNNAGYGLHGPLEEVSLDDARQQFETNVFAVARLCQLALPGMRRRRRGRILNMSSMGGRITFPGGSFYHASKHALEALSDALRFEVSGFGIDVVLIEPGPVRSGFGRAGIETLGPARGASAYPKLRESIRAGLRSTFEGPGSEHAIAPEEVAAVCLRALEAVRPEPRYVVGEMARTLIAQRLRDGDEAWDRFLETLYARPGTEPESSG